MADQLQLMTRIREEEDWLQLCALRLYSLGMFS